MKKRILLTLLVSAVFMFAACTNQASGAPSPAPEPAETASDSEETAGEGNILIAYFSSAGNIVADEAAKGNVGKGNTKYLAELIQAQVGGDLFFIETVNKYPANYRDTIGAAMQELRSNARPALASHVENMDDYDVIFLGYPNWWGTLPQAVLTFIEEYDFSGKTLIPFCTYEDSGVGRSIQDLGKMLSNTTLLQEFSVSQHDIEDAEGGVRAWLESLKLAQ